MTSKLLDYIRPGRKNLSAAHAEAIAATERAACIPLPAEDSPVVAPSPPTRIQGPLDYPSVKNWLRDCEEHLERGRDGHAYASMALMFAVNGCTRIDDIARMTSAELKELAKDFDLEVTVGLVNRVVRYAQDDVEQIKVAGRLSM